MAFDDSQGGWVPTGEATKFRQRVWFDDHRFAFSGATSDNGQIRIQRDSDLKYWNGASWVTTETWVATTIDVTNKEHYYDGLVPPTTMRLQEIQVTMRVNNDEATQETMTFVVADPAAGRLDVEVEERR